MPLKKRRGPVPAKPGKVRQYLIDNFTLTADPSEFTVCKIGHVLLFFSENDSSPTKTVNWMFEKFGFQADTLQISGLTKKCLPLMKGFTADTRRKKFEQICQDAFVLHYPPRKTIQVAQTTDPVPSTSTSVHDAHMADPVPSTSVPVHDAHMADTVPSTSTPLQSTPVPSTPPRKLRGMEDTPRIKVLKRRLSFLSAAHAKQTKRLRRSLQDVRKKVKETPYVIRSLKQKVKRKETRIQQLREALKTKESTKELRKARVRIQRLRGQLEALKEKNNRLNSELSQKLKEKDKVIANLKADQVMFEEDVEDLSGGQGETSSSSSKKDKKTYSLRTRMMVFDMILSQVPTCHVSALLKKILSRATGITLENVPHRTTVEKMTRELGIITDLQAAEIAMTTPNLTLGMDATTQEGVHMNCIHFTDKPHEKDTCFVIAIDQLPGGTADDYHQHICESIDHLSNVYSQFHSADYQETRNTIISNIANTMTDRAAVNHATIIKVNSSWGKTLNELNCHLHPLDTIAANCRAALKSLEEKKGVLYGKDCLAGSIVLQMNKMRYKDGKGDPKGFASFLDENHLPKGILPRYRGNRLHILFHSCGILMQHYTLFLEFLTTGYVSCDGLQSSLRQNFSNESARKEMCVLGLLGKVLTGPWMRKFYASAAEQEIDHIEGIQVVKDVLAAISERCKDPLGLLTATTDFFGNNLENPVFKSLQIICPRDEEVKTMVLCCLSAIITVIQKQYERYFTMDLTEQLKQETASARLHNIDAEEMMGMFSAAQNRAPNATMQYLSSKLRATKNKAVDYLDSLDEEKKEALVNWAIKKAKKETTLHRLRHKEMRLELSRRSAAKKEEKERRKIEKIEKALKGVVDIRNSFPELEEKALADLTDILQDSIVGRSICHLWYNAESGAQCPYYGLIEKLKIKKDSRVYVVAYWKPKESYDDAVDFEMDKFQLAADVVCGDLLLS